jgi:hypothetical protein
MRSQDGAARTPARPKRRARGAVRSDEAVVTYKRRRTGTSGASSDPGAVSIDIPSLAPRLARLLPPAPFSLIQLEHLAISHSGVASRQRFDFDAPRFAHSVLEVLRILVVPSNSVPNRAKEFSDN